VAGIAVSSTLAVGLACFFLVVKARRRVRARSQSRGVMVAELVERAAWRGEPTRLNWSQDQLDAYGRVRPEAHDDLPTAVFPAFKGSNNTYRDKQ
jgi:hypothetical protein